MSLLPLPSDALPFGIVAAGTAAAAVIDLRTRRIPNVLTMSMAGAGLALAAAGLGAVGIGSALAGCALGGALMLPGHVLGKTGAGDVKLLAATGAFLGPALTLNAFVVTAIAGGVLAVIVAVQRGRLTSTVGATARLVRTGGRNAPDIESTRSNNRFAYAPAIAIGVIAAALFTN
jgi:prepilin peptidase CpaA